MAYRIKVGDPAERDIEEAVRYIARDSQAAASKWYESLWKLIFSLSDNPHIFSLIPEADDVGYPYQSAIHYSHRIIFRVDATDNTIYVVRVYHRARQPLTKDDLS